MNFTLRPSKNFLFNVVESRLSRQHGAVGVDAAAANFKNRRFFKTTNYYGIDIDLKSLRSGINRFTDAMVFGIHADLARISSIPEGSVDVVVSTNTLYHLPDTDRHLAVAQLCRIVAPDGLLLVDLPIQLSKPTVLEILQRHFHNVQPLYYRNAISRYYEHLFERNGSLGSHPVAGTKPFRLLAGLLGAIEYATCAWPWGNTQVLFMCTKKKNQTKCPFDLTGIPRIEDRLYDLLAPVA